jgi:hypothetical protein
MATYPGGHVPNGLGRDPMHPSCLAVADAAHQQMENGLEQVGSLPPVRHRERLLTEVTSTVTASVPLDDTWVSQAREETVPDEPP